MTDSLRIDGQKLEYHPHRVAQWLDSRTDTEAALAVAPIYIEVSPVGACNHRCTFCAVDYIGYRPTYLDAHVITDRLHEAAGMGVKSVMFAGEGEPLLHKRINEIASSAVASGLDVSYTTNGTLLNRVDLGIATWCKVSINAGTAVDCRLSAARAAGAIRSAFAHAHAAKGVGWAESRLDALTMAILLKAKRHRLRVRIEAAGTAILG